MKKSGKCIFCGKGNLSKEHIFPQWMAKVVPIPRGGVSDHWHETALGWGAGRKRRPAPFRSQTLRVVCKGCNNGWMSTLQTEAMQVLTASLLGTLSIINDDDRMLLTRWALMTIAVWEMAAPDLQTLSYSERQDIMFGREPGSLISVFHATTVDEYPGGMIFQAALKELGFFCGTIIVGKMAVQVVRNGTLLDMSNERYAKLMKADLLSPYKSTDTYQSLKPLTHTELIRFRDTLTTAAGFAPDQREPLPASVWIASGQYDAPNSV